VWYVFLRFEREEEKFKRNKKRRIIDRREKKSQNRENASKLMDIIFPPKIVFY